MTSNNAKAILLRHNTTKSINSKGYSSCSGFFCIVCKFVNDETIVIFIGQNLLEQILFFEEKKWKKNINRMISERY